MIIATSYKHNYKAKKLLNIYTAEMNNKNKTGKA